MRRLAGVSELIDGPLDDPVALRGNLRDLAWINRRLGGTAASRRAVDRLLSDRPGPHSLLDVGTGAADIPLALLADGRQAGRLARVARARALRAGAVRAGALRVTALDARPEVLDAARALDARLAPGATRHLELVVGDGRALPWADGTFDIVHASLLLHHLEPPDAVAFLGEAARVARHGVVVNDLVRARHHWLGARALLALTTRNRYTRHDGPLSILRAYTRPELRALLAAAGLRPVAEVAAFAGHRVAIAAVPVARESRR